MAFPKVVTIEIHYSIVCVFNWTSKTIISLFGQKKTLSLKQYIFLFILVHTVRVVRPYFRVSWKPVPRLQIQASFGHFGDCLLRITTHIPWVCPAIQGKSKLNGKYKNNLSSSLVFLRASKSSRGWRGIKYYHIKVIRKLWKLFMIFIFVGNNDKIMTKQQTKCSLCAILRAGWLCKMLRKQLGEKTVSRLHDITSLQIPKSSLIRWTQV